MGRIGKVLTPILLAVIAIIVGKALITPIGEFGAPTEAYSALFKGFIDGYLTLDGLAALVFGNVVIHALKEKELQIKQYCKSNNLCRIYCSAWSTTCVFSTCLSWSF